jgi:hypothetical protein
MGFVPVFCGGCAAHDQPDGAARPVDDALARFLADYDPTPAPGRWTRRDRAEVAGPCGDCGAAVFAVSRAVREAGADEDGTPRRWTAIEAHCTQCALLTDRKVVSKKRIGTYDKRTGLLTIEETGS